jgi:hypothetical protein
MTALPQLKAIGMKGSGGFELELLGRQGATYELQISTNLSTWTPWITTNISDSLRLLDATPSNVNCRFYRALTQ